MAMSVSGVDLHGVFRWQFERNCMFLQHHLETKCVQYFDNLRQKAAQFVSESYRKECRRIERLKEQGHTGRIAKDFSPHEDGAPTRFTVLFFEKDDSIRNEKLDLMSLERLQESLVYAKWSKEWFRDFAMDYLQRDIEPLGRVTRDVILAHRRMMFWNKDIHGEDDDLIPQGTRCLQDVCCKMMEIASHHLLSQLSLFSDRVTIHQQSAHHMAIRAIVREALKSALVVIKWSGVTDASELVFHTSASSFNAVHARSKDKRKGRGFKQEEDEEEEVLQETKHNANVARITALETELRLVQEQQQRDNDGWRVDMLDCVRQASNRINFLQPTLDSFLQTNEESLDILKRMREDARSSTDRLQDGFTDILNGEMTRLIGSNEQQLQEHRRMQPELLRPVLDQLGVITSNQETVLEVLEQVEKGGRERILKLNDIKPAIDQLNGSIQALEANRNAQRPADPRVAVAPVLVIDNLIDAPLPPLPPVCASHVAELAQPFVPVAPAPVPEREQREGEPDQGF